MKRESKNSNIALLCGVVAAVLFPIVVVAAAAQRTDYDHVRNFISELGANGTPHADLMNYGGFVTTGLLLVVFGIALARVVPRQRLGLVGSLLVTLFGVGVAVSGIVSCDAGCPQVDGSFENLAHNRIAPLSFLCLIVAMAILSRVFRRHEVWQSLSSYSLASSVLSTVGLVLLATSLESRELTGLWQRLLLVVLFQWCAVVALYAFFRSDK